MMDKETVDVFLPDPEDCYERLRRAEAGATVSCVYCGESEPVIKKGTTGKGAQQYRCKECETYFNDLTGTVFEHRKFPIEEMFYMIKEMRSVPTAQIAADLGRDKDAVLDFRHAIQEVCGNIDEITLSEVCEADEIYVVAGEKGVEKEDEEGRDRGLKKGRGSFESDKLPVVTLVRRTSSVMLTSIAAKIATASFASGWRSSEVSRSTIFKATSTFSAFCKMKRPIGSTQS